MQTAAAPFWRPASYIGAAARLVPLPAPRHHARLAARILSALSGRSGAYVEMLHAARMLAVEKLNGSAVRRARAKASVGARMHGIMTQCLALTKISLAHPLLAGHGDGLVMRWISRPMLSLAQSRAFFCLAHCPRSLQFPVIRLCAKKFPHSLRRVRLLRALQGPRQGCGQPRTLHIIAIFVQ